MTRDFIQRSALEVGYTERHQPYRYDHHHRVLRFKSAEKPDNLYREDVWACVMDEASRMREEAFHAVRSTLTATRGPIHIIGNVKGRKNWFYIGCRKAEAKEPITASTRSRRSMPWLPVSSPWRSLRTLAAAGLNAQSDSSERWTNQTSRRTGLFHGNCAKGAFEPEMHQNALCLAVTL
ncbi:hypothetical protein [Bradyrhizobium sp. Rc3b]|uniref:hypothetical protein n=1 Tax=Bradyrhizobium sp. Rc3b TaxID=1855322 RepID=UPI0015A6F0CB|nr:hypothetical protein [Bradyrhizobium sp. Rc3b]